MNVSQLLLPIGRLSASLLADGGLGDLVELLIVLAIIAISAIGQALQKMSQKAKEKRQQLEAEAEAAKMRASVGKPAPKLSATQRLPQTTAAPPQVAMQRSRALAGPSSDVRRGAPAGRSSPSPARPAAPPVRPQPAQRPITGRPTPISVELTKQSAAPGAAPVSGPVGEGPRSARRQRSTTVSSVEGRHLESLSPHLLSQIEQRAQRTSGRVVDDAPVAAASSEAAAPRRDGFRSLLHRTPQEWRQAMVLSEVLGPPVSLREPSSGR